MQTSAGHPRFCVRLPDCDHSCTMQHFQRGNERSQDNLYILSVVQMNQKGELAQVQFHMRSDL